VTEGRLLRELRGALLRPPFSCSWTLR